MNELAAAAERFKDQGYLVLSGLAERQRVARLAEIAAERGIGILLIDHDLRFVNRLCDWIVVMNRGQLIAQGTPDDIRNDPSVIEAYIGRGRAAQTTTKPDEPTIEPKYTMGVVPS